MGDDRLALVDPGDERLHVARSFSGDVRIGPLEDLAIGEAAALEEGPGLIGEKVRAFDLRQLRNRFLDAGLVWMLGDGTCRRTRSLGA